MHKRSHEVFTLHIRYINRTHIGVTRESGGHGPSKNFGIFSHFALQEAVSPTKYCCSPKIKHFDPPKILAWPCHCAR